MLACSPGSFFEFYQVPWALVVNRSLIIRDKHEVVRIFDIDRLVSEYRGTPLVLDEKLECGHVSWEGLVNEDAKLLVCYAYPSRDDRVLNLIAYDGVFPVKLYRILMVRYADQSYRTADISELRGTHSLVNDNFFDAHSQNDLAVLFLRLNHRFLIFSERLREGYASVSIKPFKGGISVTPSANSADLIVFHFDIDEATRDAVRTTMNAFVISLEAFLRFTSSMLTHIDLFDLEKLARMKFHYTFSQPVCGRYERFWFSQCFTYLMGSKINQGQFLLWLLDDRMQVLVHNYLNNQQAVYHLVSFLADGSVDVMDLSFAATAQLL